MNYHHVGINPQIRVSDTFYICGNVSRYLSQKHLNRKAPETLLNKAFIPQNKLKTSHAICQIFFGMRLTIIGTKPLISILAACRR
jgi:hypothetical protein